MPLGQFAMLIQLACIAFCSWKCLSLIIFEYQQFLIPKDMACSQSPQSSSEEQVWLPPTHTFSATAPQTASLQLLWDWPLQSIIHLVGANNICFYHIMFSVMRESLSEAEKSEACQEWTVLTSESCEWFCCDGPYKNDRFSDESQAILHSL